MKKSMFFGALLAAVLPLSIANANAAPCLKVTLTGTQGGPPVFQGQAGSGTLVEYGEEENNCGNIKLQFDTGRGTTQRLSQAKVPVGKLDAIFFTHLHSDHSEGLADMLQIRWHFNSGGPKVDLVCSEDVTSPAGHTMSCAKFAQHIGDPLIQSGEMAQRLLENKKRLAGGPADIINLMTFAATDEPAVVWSKDNVSVSAIRSTHIAGHASYRVDTPGGSVVIGGDAGNDTRKPPRVTSTSAQVEKLAQGADIIVHSTIHPVMGPDKDSGFPPPVYFRQSTAKDLGAMAERAGAKHLVYTHLIPPMGAAKQGPFPIPGGALTEDDYKASAVEGGYTGNVVVGTDLTTVQLP
ncbi:MAG: MBL fold metallo-hydrolase [Pseudomonadota bacterium]